MTLLAQNPSQAKSDAATRAEALAIISDFGGFSNSLVRYHYQSVLAKLGASALKTEALTDIAHDLEASERFRAYLNGRR